MARTAGLNVVVTGDTKGLDRALGSAHKGLDKLGKQTSVTARATSKGFTGIGLAARGMAAGVGAGVLGVGFLVKQFEESNKVAKQTDAVLKSTGGTAHVTAKQVGDLATAISRKTGMDDEAIQSGENLLLTFTNVRNEAGKGNKIFDESTRVLADMSAALGQDTKSSAIQLGKALNDPIKGVTALQRVGVSFTGKQKEQIKTLVESGKTLDAQKLILGELTKEFGGSAAAHATAFDKLKVSAGNLAETAGGVLAPALSAAAGWLNGMLEDIQDGKGPIAGFLSSIGDLGGKIIDQFDKITHDPRGPAAAIGAMIVAGVDSIDWGALGQKVSAGFNAALRIGGKVGSAILDAFKQIPWDRVGDTIGDGVSGAMQLGDKLPAQISAGLGQAVSQVNGRQVLGKLVDIIGEAIDALFSPSFWIDHFKAILSVVTLVIPVGKLLKIPGFSTLFRFISKPVFQAIEALGRGMLSLFSKASAEAGIRFLSELEKVAPKTAGFLLTVVTKGGRALSGLPGRLGGIAVNAAEAVARKLGDGIGAIVGAVAKWSIRSVGRLRAAIPGFVKVAASIGAAVVTGILTGLGQLGHKIRDKVIDAVKFAVNIGSSPVSIGKSIGDAIAHGVGIGDGPGKLLGGDFGGGNFGGGLMGARPVMAPFASIGSRFGLQVSSGRRPGSITSSGNVSYHSTGEAIDEAGPPSGMLRFFNYMKNTFGGRLAELIYTPGGVGIKDGRPYRYGGQVAADHFDHVHVAVDTGAPGVGDGIGQIKGLWTQAGGRKSAAGVAAAVAMAESGGGAGKTHRNADGSIDRGLWQINSVHGAMSTTNRLGNARAAVKISSNGRNWSPWVAFTSGAYKKFLSGSQGGGNSSSGGAVELGPGGSVQGGAGNTAAGAGSTMPGGQNEPLLGPGQGGYEQQVADVGVREGRARGRDNLRGLIRALQDELRLKRHRIRRIRRLLKRHLKKATRLALTQELSTLIGEVGDLSATLKEYRADERGGATTISEAETMDAGVAPDTGGDVSAPADVAPDTSAADLLTSQHNDLIAQQNDLIATQIAEAKAIRQLVQAQGPQLVAGLTAILSGGIGGTVALGFQTPGYAGTSGGVRY